MSSRVNVKLSIVAPTRTSDEHLFSISNAIAVWHAVPRSALRLDLRKCAGTSATSRADAGQCRTCVAMLPPNGEWASHFATAMTSTRAFAPSFSLVARPRPEAAAWVTCVRRFFCGPERASAVCECRQKPFNANTRAWGVCARNYLFPLSLSTSLGSAKIHDILRHCAIRRRLGSATRSIIDCTGRSVFRAMPFGQFA